MVERSERLTPSWRSPYPSACGDNTRTVTGCPLAGIDADEGIAASPYVMAIDRHLNGNPAAAGKVPNALARLCRAYLATTPTARPFATGTRHIGDVAVKATLAGTPSTDQG
jgi:hypothetical protein